MIRTSTVSDSRSFERGIFLALTETYNFQLETLTAPHIADLTDYLKWPPVPYLIDAPPRRRRSFSAVEGHALRRLKSFWRRGRRGGKRASK